MNITHGSGGVQQTRFDNDEYCAKCNEKIVIGGEEETVVQFGRAVHRRCFGGV